MVRVPDRSNPGRGSRRVAFAAGVVIGMILGLFSLLTGPIVLILALPFVPAVLRSATVRAGVSGGLIAGGLTWLVVIGLAEARCTTVITPTSYSTCTAPDGTGWVVAAMLVVAVGLALAIVVWRPLEARLRRGNARPPTPSLVAQMPNPPTAGPASCRNGVIDYVRCSTEERADSGRERKPNRDWSSLRQEWIRASKPTGRAVSCDRL